MNELLLFHILLFSHISFWIILVKGREADDY